MREEDIDIGEGYFMNDYVMLLELKLRVDSFRLGCRSKSIFLPDQLMRLFDDPITKHSVHFPCSLSGLNGSHENRSSCPYSRPQPSA